MARTKEMDDLLTKIGGELPPDVLERMLREADVVTNIMGDRRADPFLQAVFGEIGCYVGDIVSYLKLDEHEAFQDRTQGDVFKHLIYAVGAWLAAHPEQWWTYVEEKAPGQVAQVVANLAEEMGATKGPEN